MKLRDWCLPVLIALAACESESTAPPEEEPGPEPTNPVSVVLTPDTFSLEAGQSRQLTATVANATDTRVVYRSSNEAVATVSAAGMVSARSAGNALLTATAVASSGAIDGSIVTVRAQGPPAGHVTHLLRSLGQGRIFDRATAEVAVAGNYAYTTTCCFAAQRGNVLNIWSVDGDTPVLRNSITVNANLLSLGDVQISADQRQVVIASEYLGGGFTIFDRTDPVQLRQTGTWESPVAGGCHTLKLWRAGSKHYVFCSSGRYLYVVDITTPATPVVVHRIEYSGTFIHDVLVRDGLLFTAEWVRGMGIYDIGGAGRGGTPENPVRISGVETVGGSVHNFWWMQDQKTGSKRYVFVGEEGPGSFPRRTSGDLHVVDISDLNNPREVAFLHVDPNTTSNGEPAGPHNFTADEENGIVYAAWYNGGVRAIDARGDLSACTATQRAADGRCDLRLMGREIGRGLVTEGPVGIWGVVYQNRRVYASDMLSGLWILDASVWQR